MNAIIPGRSDENCRGSRHRGRAPSGRESSAGRKCEQHQRAHQHERTTTGVPCGDRGRASRESDEMPSASGMAHPLRESSSSSSRFRKNSRRNIAAGNRRAIAQFLRSVDVWPGTRSKTSRIARGSRQLSIGQRTQTGSEIWSRAAKAPTSTKYWLAPPISVAKRKPATSPARETRQALCV